MDHRTLRVVDRNSVLSHRGVSRRYARLALWVAASDVLCLEVAILGAWFIRRGFRHLPLHPLVLLGLAPFILLSVFGSFRVYSLSRLSPADEFRRLIIAVSGTLSVLLVFAFWSRAGYSRTLIFLIWLLLATFILTERRLWHWWMGRLRARGDLMFRTLIVGTNDEAESLAAAMAAPQLGFRVIGHIRTGPANGHGEHTQGRPVFGDMDHLQEAIQVSGADCLFVASTAVTAAEMGKVAKAVRLEGVEVRVSANIANILSTRLDVQQIGRLMALSLKPVRLSGIQAAAKRTVDIILSLAAGIVSLPLWLAIAVAIKLDSRGPVFHGQERVGQHGRRFRIVKFRTMVNGAETMLEDLKPLNEATGPLFKLRRDPRVTRLGRWLRKWSLDELPQLWNVLKGEMSLVGPRPPLPNEVASYEDWHLDRLEVPPGITGLWQVRGRSELGFDDYVRLDLFYIENWSIAYDLFILVKTLPAVFGRKGAY